MALTNKMAPGCGCCGCETFSDDFDRADSSSLGSDWAELAGDWSIATNQLVIDSTAAAVRCEDAQSSTDMAVICDVSADDNGDKVRVCVRMADASNYSFCEIEFGASSSTVRIFQRSSGSDGSALDSVASSDITTGNVYQVTVCIENVTLSAVVANSSGKRLVELSGTVAGSGGTAKAGLATGGALTTEAQFNDFLIQKRQDDCQECGRCLPLPYTDDFSSVDAQWSFTTGVSITGGVLDVGDVFNRRATRCALTPSGSGWSITYEIDLAAFPTGTDFIDRAAGFGFTGQDLVSLSIYLEAVITGGSSSPTKYVWHTAASSGDIATAPAANDTLKIVVTESGGNYDIGYYVNGVLKHTASGVSTSIFGGSFFYGAECSAGFGSTGTWQFDNLSISS